MHDITQQIRYRNSCCLASPVPPCYVAPADSQHSLTSLLTPHDEPVLTSALCTKCSVARDSILRAVPDSSDPIALQVGEWESHLLATSKGTHHFFIRTPCRSPPHPSCCPCYGPARAGVSEITRQGGRDFAAAAQSGRDFLTTLFLIRCPFVKRVTKTVRWHPRAQHSVHIVAAVQCDSISAKQQDYGLFLTDGRVLLRMAKKWPRWQADFPMGLAPSAVLNRDICRFGIVHNPR